MNQEDFEKIRNELLSMSMKFSDLIFPLKEESRNLMLGAFIRSVEILLEEKGVDKIF